MARKATGSSKLQSDRRERPDPWFLICGGGGLLVTIGCLAGYFMMLDYFRRAEAWPTVTGIVTAAAIGKSSGRGNWPRAEVEYRYTVDGRTYDSDRVMLIGSQTFWNRQAASEWIQRYPVGGPVRVLIDPGNPSFSALIAGRGAGEIHIGTACGLLLLIAAWFLRPSWLIRRRKSVT